MPLTLGAIVLNTTPEAAAFWPQALNFTPSPTNPDFLLPPPAAPATRLHLDTTDRTHLDLWLTPGSTPEAEITRLLALGATRPPWTYPTNPDFTVLQSPDGTPFCIIN